jgi:hypothetical protein
MNNEAKTCPECHQEMAFTYRTDEFGNRNTPVGWFCKTWKCDPTVSGSKQIYICPKCNEPVVEKNITYGYKHDLALRKRMRVCTNPQCNWCRKP